MAPAPGPVIVLVAGEVSGDLLGADLIRALRHHFPHARFVGIGGDRMVAAGLQSIVPMERLSVMGLVEVLGRLRELFRIRARIREYCLNNRPAILIGIDSPDFTLGLEKQVRDEGIPTAHYVSPTVWAWRQGRIKGIARSVDLMLTLLPFEAQFYRDHQVPVRFVGHPMADQIPMTTDQPGARSLLGLDADSTVVAILPGSRGGEMGFLAPLFLQAAAWLVSRNPESTRRGHWPPLFLVPCSSRARRLQMEEILVQPEFRDLKVCLIDGQSRNVMAAADAVLLASGTATLEAALLKRPMVVAYRLKPMSFQIVKRLVQINHIALPNLLAPEPVVPEFIQDDATPEALGEALLERLTSDSRVENEQAVFTEMHRTLRRNASARAAESIAALINGEPLPDDLTEDEG